MTDQNEFNQDKREMLSNDDVIDKLNGLIETCKDGHEGFKTASEGVERSDLKTELYENSQKRAQFAGDLQQLVRSLGGDPEKSGSFAAAIHRGWIDIKAAVTGKDEKAILNECERGEDHAKAAYEEVMKCELPANVAAVVRDQYVAVKAAHDRVKALRNAEQAKDASTF